MKKLIALLVMLGVVVTAISGCNQTSNETLDFIQLNELQNNQVAYCEKHTEATYVAINTYQTYADSIENAGKDGGQYFVAKGISSMEMISSSSSSKWKELSKEELGEEIIKFYTTGGGWYQKHDVVTCRFKNADDGKYRYFSWKEE